MTALSDKRILLVVGGGIAAYKALDLIRRLRERGAVVVPVMTRAAAEFVTPLSVGALAGGHVYSDLFDRTDEQDVGHIRLARGCDAVVVAPATAGRMAKLAHGLADDLASAILLATTAPVLLAPAMNPAMWAHPATVRNVERLRADGIAFVGPNAGEMAESGEAGIGRMAEPLEIVAALDELIFARAGEGKPARAGGDVPSGILVAGPSLPMPKPVRTSGPVVGPVVGPMAGRRVVVTSGPTHEPIDPVRYIANRSSGRQGHAIAAALAELGAEVVLVSGPVTIPPPAGVGLVSVETAREMMDAVEAALPADVGIFVAAVADWRISDASDTKLKKTPGVPLPTLALTENPDILATVGHHRERPRLVVGFAAETNDLLANAASKLDRKGADIIVANDVSVSEDGGGVMGGADNRVHLLTRAGSEAWPTMSKEAVAERLALRIAELLGDMVPR